MHSLKRREEAGDPPWLWTVSFLLPWMLSKAAKISSCWIYFNDCRANSTLLSTSCLNQCVPKVWNKGSTSKPSGEKPVSLSAGFCFDITSLLLSSQLCIVLRSHSHAGAGAPLTGCSTVICNMWCRSLDLLCNCILTLIGYPPADRADPGNQLHRSYTHIYSLFAYSSV